MRNFGVNLSAWVDRISLLDRSKVSGVFMSLKPNCRYYWDQKQFSSPTLSHLLCYTQASSEKKIHISCEAHLSEFYLLLYTYELFSVVILFLKLWDYPKRALFVRRKCLSLWILFPFFTIVFLKIFLVFSVMLSNECFSFFLDYNINLNILFN